MQEWREGVLRPELYPGLHRAGVVMEREAEDGGRLVAAVFGDGVVRRPFLLFVHYQAPAMQLRTAAEPERQFWGRPPTLKEMESAIHATIPEGALMALAPFRSFGPGHRPEPLDREWVALMWNQMGAIAGTHAGRLWQIGGGRPLPDPTQEVQRGIIQ